MNKLAEELLTIPETIRLLELQFLDNLGKKQDAEMSAEVIKAQVDQTIAEEIGEDGKPKHGNEFKRKAESIKRLAENSEYAGRASELSELVSGAKKLEIKLRYFQNQLKVLTALAEGKYL